MKNKDPLQELQELRKENNQLKKVVNQLVQRFALLERETKRAHQTARNAESKISHLASKQTLTETKVTRVEQILRRY